MAQAWRVNLERFKLALAAWARDDEGELSALRNTTRKATYTMTAWPYRGMWDGLEKAVWATVTNILTTGWHLALCCLLDYAQHAGDRDDDGDFIPWLAAYTYAEKIIVSWSGSVLQRPGPDLDHALTQAPGVESARDVVDFAIGKQVEQETFHTWLAREVAKDTGEEADQAVSEALACLAEQRQERTQACADLLRQIYSLPFYSARVYLPTVLGGD